MQEFAGYISVNLAFIPNYGDRYRHGEPIATAFVASTVNQVISKRFVKQHHKGWTKWGVHVLLHVRSQVLNDDLRETFRAWYPEMTPPAEAAQPRRARAAEPPLWHGLQAIRFATPARWLAFRAPPHLASHRRS